jgi:hypothetical protein
MKRAVAVTAVLAAVCAVLLAGCRNRIDQAGSGPAPAPASTSTTNAPAPAAGSGKTSSGDVDTDLSTVDGLLGQLDDEVNKADQTPPDAD